MAEILKITRKRLFDEIWSETPTRAAAKFDISYHKLKEVCAEHNIPLPPPRYNDQRKKETAPQIPVSGSDADEVIEIERVEHRGSKNSAQLTSKANTLCILELLREYSDHDRILTMSEIISKMAAVYGLHVTRSTVYSCIAVLIDMNYDISTYEDNGRGYYLESRELEPSEVRLLTDSVYSNTAISSSHSEMLIKKLQTFLPEHKRMKCSNLLKVSTSRKSPNKEVFLNIELIDEAITNNTKIVFEYMQYDLKKELVPKRDRPYRVSPYAMVASNDGYYLLCRSEDRGGISIYRVDKMKKLSITGEPGEPRPAGFNAASYKDESVLMYSGERVEARLKCDNSILGHVIDKFGNDAKLHDNNDGATFTAVVRGSFDGLRIWAVHYLDVCEVTSPQRLRDDVIRVIKNNKYGISAELSK